MQKIIHTVIHAGLAEPVRIMHLTDPHLTFTDDRDPDWQVEHQKGRSHDFYNEGGNPPRTPADYFEEGIRLGEEAGAILVCTGDVMDIQTYGNAAAFHRITDGHDMLFTPGGHEQQKRCVRTMEEGDGYWIRARKRLSEMLPGVDLDFQSRVVGGLNIVLADNSLDYYSKVTLDRFKAELDRGLPMIVFGHDPIRDELLNATSRTHPQVELTGEDYRVSHEMIDLIETHPLVKAFVGGHDHVGSEGHLRNGNPWYVTPGLFYGICRLIEVR